MKKLIILLGLFIFLSGCGVTLTDNTIPDVIKTTHTFYLTWEWDGDSNILAGYNVYRQVKPSHEEFIKVNKDLVQEKKYEDKIINYNKDFIYCYSVSSVGKDGQEAKSKIKCSDEGE